jgi:hypothetical protein
MVLAYIFLDMEMSSVQVLQFSVIDKVRHFCNACALLTYNVSFVFRITDF